MQTSTTHAASTTEVVQETHVDYAWQAFEILRWGFVAAPLLAGVDKFFHFLVDWNKYLAPDIANFVGQIGLGPRTLMQIVGAIEIVAAALVALKPRIGAYVVAIWLVGIIINLLILPGFYDIALRDFGLFLGAIALGRLSERYNR